MTCLFGGFTTSYEAMHWDDQLWQKSQHQLSSFLTPLVEVLGRSERRVAATRYVTGLLLPGQRKSIAPMSERLGVDSQSLQQFLSDSPWEEKSLWSAIGKEVIPSLEPIDSWVIDETGWLKQGDHSVGVSHQYCGAVGKQANCQVSVELAVSDGTVAAPVAGRLYLPQKWTEDATRCAAAGVPEEISFATKPQIAVCLLEEALADGLCPAPVLADSAYGDSGDFRAELRRLKLEFFLQVTGSSHKGWTRSVPTELKFKRRHVKASAPAAQTLAQITAALPQAAWKHCSWKSADNKTRRTRLAWIEVYLAHGLREAGGELEKVWLVIDWPKGDESPYHYYLAHFKDKPTKARSLKLSRSRWHIEQYFQRSKDDLGLDHFEGRSWRGFHHHLALSAVAYLFILVVLLRAKKNFWPDVGSGVESDPPLVGEINRLLSLLRQGV
jgi:SRSO17 transposase